MEESIESERAAHLETKFNSEIVQVNVTYLLVLIDLKPKLSQAIDTLCINGKNAINSSYLPKILF